MRTRDIALLALILSTASIQARASEWYPVATGRHWLYSDPYGGTVTATVQAPEMFEGTLVQPLLWETGGREHLTVDGSGRVLFHGVSNPDGSYFVFYPPTIRMDADLTPGHTWESVTEAVLYTPEGVEYRRAEAVSTFEVLSVGPVTVPAGTFQAVEIRHTETSFLFPPVDVRDTFAEGIGWIRRTDASGFAVYFQLLGYGLDGVRNQDSSWGGVKALFSD